MAFTVISAVLFYVLSALFVDDVGKLHMDAATAAGCRMMAVLTRGDLMQIAIHLVATCSILGCPI